MSVTYHKYLGKTEMPPPDATKARRNGQSPKEKLDSAWRKERIAHERSKRALSDAKLARAKGELIARSLVIKQASYLVICLRERLLAVPAIIGRLAGLSERELELSVSAELRMVLDEFADFPQKVVDPKWMARLSEEGDE